MKTLIKALTLSAFLGTSSFAEDYQEPPVVVETPTPESNSQDALVAIGLIALFVLLVNQNKDSSTQLDAPRPLVDPDVCLDKDGTITGC